MEIYLQPPVGGDETETNGTAVRGGRRPPSIPQDSGVGGSESCGFRLIAVCLYVDLISDSGGFEFRRFPEIQKKHTDIQLSIPGLKYPTG